MTLRHESHLNPPEPLIVGKCEYCDAELYSKSEYKRCANTRRWFCDDNCYVDQQLYEGELVTEVIGD